MDIISKLHQLAGKYIESLPVGKQFIINTLRLPQGDKFYWDPWILKDGDVYRLFYLVGSTKADPFWKEGKIYGAISTDMKQWKELGIILESDPATAWESGRMLAGSTYKEDGVYYLFYSAAGKDMAIGYEEIALATSLDGLHWQRSSPPEQLFSNLEERELWYGNYATNDFYWRDPYIVKDSQSGKYYMFICTYVKEVEVGGFGGCIGLAEADTIAGPYKLLPPIVAPAVDETKEWPYHHLERAQVIYKNGKYHLFFSCWLYMMNPEWIQKVGKANLTDSSLYYYVSDSITGPYKPSGEKPIVRGSETTGLYGINFFPAPDKPEEFIAYGWYRYLYTIKISPSLFRVYWNNNLIEIR